MRDEDLHIERVLRNVLDFCDVIEVADHGSTDRTPAILAALAAAHPKIRVRRIAEPRESNDLLQPFVSTPTWVFGIDGDEIYDPSGLVRLREELFAGRYDPWWVVFGNVLNCVEIDPQRKEARGYLAPPCRSMTKLYNFAAVQRLDPDSPQRLLGRANIFNTGWDDLARFDLYKQTPWDEAHFRCLHACFLPRSSGDAGTRTARSNITELRKLSPLGWLRRVAARLSGRAADSRWKMEKYRRGALVSIDAGPFLP